MSSILLYLHLMLLWFLWFKCPARQMMRLHYLHLTIAILIEWFSYQSWLGVCPVFAPPGYASNLIAQSNKKFVMGNWSTYSKPGRLILQVQDVQFDITAILELMLQISQVMALCEPQRATPPPAPPIKFPLGACKHLHPP